MTLKVTYDPPAGTGKTFPRLNNLNVGDLFIWPQDEGVAKPRVHIVTDEGTFVTLTDGAQWEIGLDMAGDQLVIPVSGELRWWKEVK